VTPVLAHGDGIGEAVVLAHAVTASGILFTTDTDSLGEGDIHHVLVELINGNRGRDKVVRSRGVSKDYSLVDLGGFRGHPDEAGNVRL
jgi:hypothetical protein